MGWGCQSDLRGYTYLIYPIGLGTDLMMTNRIDRIGHKKKINQVFQSGWFFSFV